MAIDEAVWTRTPRTLVTGTPGSPSNRAEEIAQAVWTHTPRTLTNGDPFAWVTLDTLGSSASSYNDTGVTPGIEYDYEILAVNAVGSTQSNMVTAQTGATAALTGTAVGGIPEADMVSGGKVVDITLTGATWA